MASICSFGRSSPLTGIRGTSTGRGGIAASAIERVAVSGGGIVRGTWSEPIVALKRTSRRVGPASASRTA
eukprot:5313231-Prorocentrum_lima.AAC.1